MDMYTGGNERMIEYISIRGVTATWGYALTACHFEKRKVAKRFRPYPSVPRCGSACPRHRPSSVGTPRSAIPGRVAA